MFSKLSLLTISAFAAPLVSALTLHVPEAPTSQGEITITWDTAAGDPEAFSIELYHPSFNNVFAIANTVDPSQGSVTVTLPVVPADSGYTLQAVNIGNINDIYSETAPFSIAAATGTVSGTPSSTRTSASVSGSAISTVASGSLTRSISSASPSASGSSASTGSNSVSSPPPEVTNLNEDGAAASTVASRLGFLGAAVAGAVLVF